MEALARASLSLSEPLFTSLVTSTLPPTFILPPTEKAAAWTTDRSAVAMFAPADRPLMRSAAGITSASTIAEPMALIVTLPPISESL